MAETLELKHEDTCPGGAEQSYRERTSEGLFEVARCKGCGATARQEVEDTEIERILEDDRLRGLVESGGTVVEVGQASEVSE